LGQCGVFTLPIEVEGSGRIGYSIWLLESGRFMMEVRHDLVEDNLVLLPDEQMVVSLTLVQRSHDPYLLASAEGAPIVSFWRGPYRRGL
jgi:hypothetical protein